MSHYAKIVNDIVEQVIVAEADFFTLLPESDEWIQTSYNTRGNQHYGPDGLPDGGTALRGNFAGIGYIYDRTNDVFYPPQFFPSWTIGADTNWLWTAPVARPQDGKQYAWDEPTQSWVERSLI